MVQGGERQRPEHEVFEASRRECTLEVEWRRRAGLGATRDDDPTRCGSRRTDELERAPGGAVQPLRVVDRDDEGIAAAEDRHDGQERAGRRPRVGRRVRLPKQQRHLECLPLRWRQRIAHLVEDAAHEVAEGSEREVGLGLGWPSLEHPIAVARWAARIASSTTVVLPMPGSPSIRSPTGPLGTCSAKRAIAAASPARPIMSITGAP